MTEFRWCPIDHPKTRKKEEEEEEEEGGDEGGGEDEEEKGGDGGREEGEGGGGGKLSSICLSFISLDSRVFSLISWSAYNSNSNVHMQTRLHTKYTDLPYMA